MEHLLKAIGNHKVTYLKKLKSYFGEKWLLKTLFNMKLNRGGGV